MNYQKKVLFMFGMMLSIICFSHEKEKYSRYHDVGVFGGAAFYSGDLNPYRFVDFQSAGTSLGVLYRINLDRRNSLRFGANYGFIYADDATNTENTFQYKRGLNFQTNIYEVNTIYEFNFFPYEMGYPAYPITPFILGGIGGFYFNPKTVVGDEKIVLHDLTTEGQGVKSNTSKPYKRLQVCIPLGVGVKMNLGRKLGLQAEFGVRKLFTDYLDDVSTTYPSNKFMKTEVGDDAAAFSKSIDYNKPKRILGNVGRMRGNSQNKDWYSFFGISITYKISFGSTCPSFRG